MVWNSVGGRSAGMSLEIASFFALLTHITANTSPFEGRSAIVSFALPVSESKMKASQPFLIGAFVKAKQVRPSYYIRSKMKTFQPFLIGAFVKAKQNRPSYYITVMTVVVICQFYFLAGLIFSNYFAKLLLHIALIKPAFAGFQEFFTVNFLFHC